jgi:flagellar hook-associated protein 1 FlgK
MLGLFGTLNMASASLRAQMVGVEVAGQNLANVNTPGYSRQRVVLQSDPAIQTGVGPEGSGASVQSIQQVVDTLLNGRIQDQASLNGYWNSQQSTLKSVQTALNDYLSSAQAAGGATDTGTASSNGLTAKLSKFFNALSGAATSPASADARQAVIGAAQSLADTFKQVNARLSSYHADLDKALDSQVLSANQLLTDIASLNDQIANSQNLNGGAANDLLDLRQLKLEKLAGYLNFQSATAADGSVSVTALTNQTLISGNQVVNALKTVLNTTTNQLQVFTSGSNNVLTGVPFGLTSGSLESTVDTRDGELSGLQNSINTLATNLIAEVNALHSAGFDLNGGTGANLFTGGNAAGIAVNTTVASNPSLLQLSGTAGEKGNGTVAAAMSALASTSLTALNNQTFSGSYAQSVTQLGMALNNATDRATSATSVADLLSNQRASVSGVNLDEEMTNLMTYQRAYQASAHVVSTVDQMIQVLLSMKA